ncbi:MAG: methyltransferase domain-containing protein [Candidatus Berkelbacteria bacterium]|nr:methyltransferase domain-containing protein [Candidatus Berkelbacteria bacterium]
MSEKLIQDWQEYYGESPYSDTENGIETSIEDTVSDVILVLLSSGIVERMKNESLVFIMSSVSRGEKAVGVAEKIDEILDAEENPPSQTIIATDFALKTVGDTKNAVVENSKIELKHVSYFAIACDSRNMPVADGSADIIHERMGALFHISEVGGNQIERIIREYKRILKKDGKIIIDFGHKNPRIPSSTVKEIEKATEVEYQEYFRSLGFDCDVVSGRVESYVILTLQEEWSLR